MKLKQHKRLFYVKLLTSGKLNSYLADITEKLKSTDQMAWISAMNNIQARAREIVYTDNLHIITSQKRYGILMPLLFRFFFLPVQ